MLTLNNYKLHDLTRQQFTKCDPFCDWNTYGHLTLNHRCKFFLAIINDILLVWGQNI